MNDDFLTTKEIIFPGETLGFSLHFSYEEKEMNLDIGKTLSPYFEEDFPFFATDLHSFFQILENFYIKPSLNIAIQFIHPTLSHKNNEKKFSPLDYFYKILDLKEIPELKPNPLISKTIPPPKIFYQKNGSWLMNPIENQKPKQISLKRILIPQRKNPQCLHLGFLRLIKNSGEDRNAKLSFYYFPKDLNLLFELPTQLFLSSEKIIFLSSEKYLLYPFLSWLLSLKSLPVFISEKPLLPVLFDLLLQHPQNNKFTLISLLEPSSIEVLLYEKN